MIKNAKQAESSLALHAEAAVVRCPVCVVAAGQPCIYLGCKNGYKNCEFAVCAQYYERSEPHLQRLVAARSAAQKPTWVKGDGSLSDRIDDALDDLCGCDEYRTSHWPDQHQDACPTRKLRGLLREAGE